MFVSLWTLLEQSFSFDFLTSTFRFVGFANCLPPGFLRLVFKAMNGSPPSRCFFGTYKRENRNLFGHQKSCRLTNCLLNLRLSRQNEHNRQKKSVASQERSMTSSSGRSWESPSMNFIIKFAMSLKSFETSKSACLQKAARIRCTK